MFGKTHTWLVSQAWPEMPFARGKISTDDEAFEVCGGTVPRRRALNA
jgi:hypothetical protein